MNRFWKHSAVVAIADGSRADPHAHLLAGFGFGSPKITKRPKPGQQKEPASRESELTQHAQIMACASPLKLDRSRIAEAASKDSQEPKPSKQLKGNARSLSTPILHLLSAVAAVKLG